MSYLNCLSIQGIRSFGQESEDVQRLKFFSPLTLILGPNGTGKTTIIECLRYITTGDQPPNSKGGSFIHDPILAGTIEVKGQVKLQFWDTEARKITAIRSVMGTQKKARVEMKTLDSVIERMMPNGEMSSITQKCAQIDKEMINCLGVSKPVLLYVIFCHQEESCWPLAEGKSVKEKFDAIFSATRYIKALEEIRKIRLKLIGDVREFQAEIKYLRANKDKSISLTSDMKETENRFVTSKKKIQDIQNALKPLIQKLEQISSREGEISLLRNEVGNHETSLKHLAKSREEHLNSIQDLFSGNEEELNSEIKNFSHQLNRKKNQLTEEKRNQKSTEQDCKLIRDKSSKLMMELGKLQEIEERHNQRVSKRNSRIVQSAAELKLIGYVDKQINEQKTESFIKELQKMIDVAEKEHEDAKKKYESEESILQKKLEDFHDRKLQQEQTVKLNSGRKQQNENTVQSVTRELQRLDSSGARQKQLDLSLAKLELQKTKLDDSIDVKALKNEISILQKDKNEMDIKLNEINQEINKLHCEGKKRTELEILLKDKSYKEDSIRKMTSRHEDTLLHLLGKLPKQNTLQELETYNKKVQQELRTSTLKLNEMKSKMSSLETTRSFQIEESKRKESILQKHQEKIFQVGGSNNFDETLNSTQTNLQVLQDEKGALIGSQYTYSKFIEKLVLTKPCCPLCQRGFSEEQDAQELSEHLRRKILMIPEQLEAKERQISEQQKKLTSMLELRPLQEEVKNLKNEDIPAIKKTISQVNSEIEELRTKISKTEEDVEMSQVDVKSYDNIQPDFVVANQQERELLKIEKQISLVQQTLGEQSKPSRTSEEANDEREELQLKLKSLNRSLESIQQKVSNYSDQINALNQEINLQKSELLQIMGDQQKRQSLEEQKNKLILENESISSSIQESRNDIEVLKGQWRKIKEEKDIVSDTKQTQLNQKKIQISQFNEIQNEVATYTKEIKRYIDGGNSTAVYKISERIDDLKTQLKDKETNLKSTMGRMEILQEELANQEVKERDLQDNLKLKSVEKEILILEQQLTESKNKLGSFDTTNLFKEKTTLSKEFNKLNNEKQILDGGNREQELQIIALQKELNTDQYKNADEKYRDKFISLRVSELAADDLNKYYKALDTAIMKFHKLKMDDINKIIRELWAQTYRGNDIDYIEIQADNSESSAGIEKKRVYNYKVIMSCNENKMDMRGRCSAGQRVLASLIIRLALAETFCLNCGVLALDEPTTNLDRENIESLALALIELVKSRSRQRNFQLVIITHDEDFIELLGRSNVVDYYYKVGKNDRGCSRISKCTIAEMS